jgi:hypothetical protein
MPGRAHRLDKGYLAPTDAALPVRMEPHAEVSRGLERGGSGQALRGVERVRNLDSQLQHFRKRQRLAGNAVLERLAVEKFHRNEGLTVVFADFVDGANIWMVQGGSSLCLTVEAAQSLGVWREPVRKELQGNKAVQLGVLRFIDDAHAAATELLDDAIVRNRLANHRQGLAQC